MVSDFVKTRGRAASGNEKAEKPGAPVEPQMAQTDTAASEQKTQPLSETPGSRKERASVLPEPEETQDDGKLDKSVERKGPYKGAPDFE